MEKFQTIYLGIDDDVATIIDYLRQVTARNIILVVPLNAEIFSSIINLQLLRREVDNLQKRIFLSTEDRRGRRLAESVGIDIIDELEEEFYLVKENKSAPRKVRSESNEEKLKIVKEKKITKMPPRLMTDIVAPLSPLSKVTPLQKREDATRIRKQITPVLEKSPLKEILKDDTEKELREEPEMVSRPAEETKTSVYQIRESGYHPVKELQSEVLRPEITLHPQKEEYPAKHGLLENFWPTKRKIVLPKEKITPSSTAVKRFFTVFIFLGTTVALLVFYSVLREAQIIIIPRKERVDFDVSLVADKNINQVDYALRRIPAQLIKVEKKETKDFVATGEQTIDGKARGIITVYNEFSSAPQTLVQTTRFLSFSTGKIFRTTKTITVPGAKIENGKITPSSIDVEVIADQPGPDYNIGPSDFTIPGFEGTSKYQGFYGKSKEPMIGGSLGKTKVVLQEDLDRARQEILNEIKEITEQELKNQLPQGLVLLENAIKKEEPEISFSAKAGSPQEKFTATIVFRNIAIGFEKKYLDDLVDKISVSLYGSGKEVIKETRQLNYDKWHVNFDKGQVSIDLKVKEDLVWKIDEDELKNKLLGKREQEIKKVFSQMQQIESAKVSFRPRWPEQIPKQPDKVKIVIQKEGTID